MLYHDWNKIPSTMLRLPRRQQLHPHRLIRTAAAASRDVFDAAGGAVPSHSALRWRHCSQRAWRIGMSHACATFSRNAVLIYFFGFLWHRALSHVSADR